MSATTALQLLRDDGKVQPGQKVLINGASGGVGTFAVQIAKAFGAEVTGVCSTANVEMVRSIGADHVIDYTSADFRQGAERYDLILDNVGDHSMADTRRALTPTGMLISNGGGHAGGKLGRVIRGAVASMFVRQQARPSVKTTNRADLIALKALVEAGKVTPVIGGTYPLEKTAEAIAHVAAGHARGTLVIAVPGQSDAAPAADNAPRRGAGCTRGGAGMTAQASAAPYAARLTVDYPERLDRLSTFFRLIWIIPIAIVLSSADRERQPDHGHRQRPAGRGNRWRAPRRPGRLRPR